MKLSDLKSRLKGLEAKVKDQEDTLKKIKALLECAEYDIEFVNDALEMLKKVGVK